MKNLIFYALASLCICCFYQCANENSDFTTEVSLERLAQDFNTEQQETKALLEEGKIKLGLDDNMLIIALIKNEQDQEHLAFRVQLYEPTFKAETIEKGRVFFMNNQLLIENTKTKETYFISLLNTAPHSDLATRTYTKTIEAIGIGKFTLEMDASKTFTFPPSIEYLCDCIFTGSPFSSPYVYPSLGMLEACNPSAVMDADINCYSGSVVCCFEL